MTPARRQLTGLARRGRQGLRQGGQGGSACGGLRRRPVGDAARTPRSAGLLTIVPITPGESREFDPGAGAPGVRVSVVGLAPDPVEAGGRGRHLPVNPVVYAQLAQPPGPSRPITPARHGCRRRRSRRVVQGGGLMKRWLLTGVVASAAWGGSAAGQSPRPAAPPTSPAPAATDGQPVGGVIVMKTAGQPDRQVRVIRSERMSDGKVVSEVKDLATGEVYTITDVAPGGALDAPAGDASPPRPAAAQRPVMGKVFGSKDGTLPQAKDRAADPLLAAPPGSGAAPATGPEPRQRFLSRVFGAKPTPAGTGTGEQKAAPPATAPARPAAAGGWGPAAKPMIPVPPPVAPAAPPVAPAAPPAQGPVQASMTERAGVPADQMRQEIAQYIQDLRTHSRPSFRMEAATGLCDGRY